MYHLRSAVVLLVAMAHSLAAILALSSVVSAKTYAAASMKAPIMAPAGLDEPHGCQATLCVPSMPRYKQTLITGWTEFSYDVSGNCQYEDYGSWTTLAPVAPVAPNGNAAGTVTFNGAPIQGPTPINPFTGTTCQGGDTYLYAILYFTWTLEMNLTKYPGWGPTATFADTWMGMYGAKEAMTFEVNVPVVRPIGERSAYVYAVPGTGVTAWQQTLVPPSDPDAPDGDNQADFDFSGDCVKEYVWFIVNGCNLGVLPGGGMSSFLITTGSHYLDFVGVGFSGVRTCIVDRGQMMYFNSQAETPHSYRPYLTTPNFHVISETPTQGRPNYETILVQRRTAYSANGFVPPNGLQITAMGRPSFHGFGRCPH